MEQDPLNRRLAELKEELVRCDDRLLRIAREKSELEHTISRIRGAIDVLEEYQRDMVQQAQARADRPA
ncbi:hypothetical protein [uncultured Massilia sp.]|uniref:hypothetical protein n=1 Tax=uncultured Massilia sp. TaxID=169973 RepID=UPI0025ECC68A|nr:hypothetical protein [uncultured Massilia sp.]